MGHHGISSRLNMGLMTFQLHAGEILDALKQYKVNDAFCILAVTNWDLYPRPAWNFVFGLASPEDQVGVFSFYRH